MKDELFASQMSKQFEFDDAVARVFDDMVARSVPQYEQSAALCARMLARWCKKGARVCDLGCSTASFLLELHTLRDDLELIGVDNSGAMLEKAAQKAADVGAKINLINANLLDLSSLNLGEFDAIVCAYTLHFIRPIARQDFLRSVADKLRAGGVFMLSEKLLYEENTLQKQAIDEYEDYKASRGYSRYEIAQKRAALENVLIPFSADENINLLRSAGFGFVDTLSRWLNFATFIAIK